jgi:hypothetical protein
MPKYPKRVRADKATIARALRELEINRPMYHARVVGGRLELRLYGGDVVYWPPEPGAQAPDDQPEEGASHAT